MDRFDQAFVLDRDSNALGAIEFIRANWKRMLLAGTPLVVYVHEWDAKRTNRQNRRLHAVLNDIAEQAWVEGRQFPMLTWKHYYRLKFLGTEEILLPNGKCIEHGISTTTLSAREFDEFRLRIEADASQEHGVRFREGKR